MKIGFITRHTREHKGIHVSCFVYLRALRGH